jgi:iron-regulated transporter 1
MSTISAVLCSSLVGSWIDRAPSRLPPLITTIFANHGAISAAYLCWLFWHAVLGQQTGETQSSTTTPPQACLFGFILLLDVVQELSAIGNRLSLERDWVPTLVDPIASHTEYGLTQINAVMRRIDLICKLVAPSLLPFIVSNLASHEAWILLLTGVTITLWALEVWCARMIARENPQLSDPKVNIDENGGAAFSVAQQSKTGIPHRLYKALFQDPFWRLRQYFSMSIWPASISIAILQMTVLAYSATLITYLLEIGFSLTSITIARASGSIMALTSTFITPITVRYLKRRQTRGALRKAVSNSTVVRKVGLWGIVSQFICMVLFSLLGPLVP